MSNEKVKEFLFKNLDELELDQHGEGEIEIIELCEVVQAYADEQVKAKVEEIREWLIDEDYEGLAEYL